VENRLKELHHGLELDRTSCHLFLANQFRVLLTLAAYVLFQELRRRAAGTACADAQVTTLRERLVKLAVWVERSCGDRVALAGDVPLAADVAADSPARSAPRPDRVAPQRSSSPRAHCHSEGLSASPSQPSLGLDAMHGAIARPVELSRPLHSRLRPLEALRAVVTVRS
jgi:hypothetical protein